MVDNRCKKQCTDKEWIVWKKGQKIVVQRIVWRMMMGKLIKLEFEDDNYNVDFDYDGDFKFVTYIDCVYGYIVLNKDRKFKFVEKQKKGRGQI